MRTYKKEVKFTLFMALAFIVVGNVGLFFSVFPFEGVLLFGFPVSYIIPILFGWFGVWGLTIVAGRMGNRLDDDIENEVTEDEARKEVS
ncbi:hypothetical protein ACE1TF_06010 [Geomicrobium sp. JSM 1781026]|uniref:hypothetical protein n=1 Tax=Geomicrobium sp. JSM 1781026 TaxID=3344580 RepID=UPI0035C26B11